MEEKIQSLSAASPTFKIEDSGKGASSARFSDRGYLVLRKLVTGPALSFLYEYALKSAEFAEMPTEDWLVPGTPNRFADSITESLLETLMPYLEVETGIKLHPTCSVLRVYEHGDALRRHNDRPSCEISVSLSIGNKPDEPWPIWIERGGMARSIALEPGDGLIYRGVETPHWREGFQGKTAAQILLHYVDRNGAYADWVFDRREKLASRPVTRQLVEGFRPYFYQQAGD